MSVNEATIPNELKQYSQWCNWKAVLRNGKMTKPPRNPHRFTEFADVNNANTWAAFSKALYNVKHYTKGLDGLGFILTDGDPFVVVDIDHCLENGQLSNLALDFVTELNSYSEFSPSGKGLHVFVKGLYKFVLVNHTVGVEVYSTQRFITVTGNHLPGTPLCAEERTNELTHLLTKYASAPTVRTIKTQTKPMQPKMIPPSSFSLDVIPEEDKQVWLKMFTCKIGARYRAMFDGSYDSSGDESGADIMLLNGLAYWTNYKADQMCRMALQSGLARDKWYEPRGGMSYLEFQIENAINFVQSRKGC